MPRCCSSDSDDDCASAQSRSSCRCERCRRSHHSKPPKCRECNHCICKCLKKISRGPTGPVGPEGPEGSTGPTGPSDGPIGPTGPTGSSQCDELLSWDANPMVVSGFENDALGVEGATATYCLRGCLVHFKFKVTGLVSNPGECVFKFDLPGSPGPIFQAIPDQMMGAAAVTCSNKKWVGLTLDDTATTGKVIVTVDARDECIAIVQGWYFQNKT